MTQPTAPKPPRDRRPLFAKSLFAAAILVVLAVAALLYLTAT
ncbi:MAG TPA: hypothetical protein VLA14_03915 [Polyangia bacterium]|jgi:hypothetical protein|nr:hypothetical protein [Polyangia bacterium]